MECLPCITYVYVHSVSVQAYIIEALSPSHRILKQLLYHTNTSSKVTAQAAPTSDSLDIILCT